ncbi:MAG: sugar ABC transporter permease, partial [Spirochaetaceae bacterium]|nr:sugar ABC transporter permease [Spirochaetaceae bacterium]
VALLIIIPLVFVLGLSVTNFSFVTRQNNRFVGLANFVRMATDARFWNSLRVAGVYGVWSVSIQVVLGLGISLLLVSKYRFAKASRTLLLLPLTTPPIVASLMWKLFFTPTNPGMNYVLGLFGIDGPNWFDAPFTAMSAIVIANVWQWTPFCMLLFIAALESLPQDPYQSAIVDGASSWQRFRLITLPLMWPTILFVTTFRAIESLKIFPLVYVMTGGGPGTSTEPINFYAFSTAFEFNRIGYGSALVVVMIILVVLIVVLLRRRSTNL